MGRIFASILSRYKQGTLELVTVDVERSRFKVTFAGCAECAGLSASRPLCFFHGGIFAGVLAAMLDRELCRTSAIMGLR